MILIRVNFITDEEIKCLKNYRLFEKAFRYVITYANLGSYLPYLFQEFLEETKEIEDFSFRCLQLLIGEESEEALLFDIPSHENVRLVTSQLKIKKMPQETPPKSRLNGYVNVRFSELLSILETMINLMKLEHDHGEISKYLTKIFKNISFIIVRAALKSIDI